MAIAVSTPLLPNQKKTVLQNRPIHWHTLYNFMYIVGACNQPFMEWEGYRLRMRYVFLMSMNIAVMIFCYMMLWSLIDKYKGFRRICWVHLLKVDATDSSRMFVPIYSHLVSHSRRWNHNRWRVFEKTVEESVTQWQRCVHTCILIVY
jgi:hypothetical protein